VVSRLRHLAVSLVFWAGMVITLATLGFVILRPQNLDGAITGLLGSMVGTMVGVAIGFDYDRKKMAAEHSLQQREKDVNRLEILSRTKLILREELVHNGNALLHLIDSVNKTPGARADVWAWARTVVDSFEVVAFRAFEALLTDRTERQEHEPIALFYRNLIRLKHHVRRAEAGHQVHLGFSADEAAANDELERVRTSARIGREQVHHALAILPVGDN
jgi:hypothetical protein